MSLTLQKIISDAKLLANRLKEHDTAADALLSQTHSVCEQMDVMKQYQENVSELNEVARQRPHTTLVAGIQQENQHLRKLQQENRELRASLEEHQKTLELIMSKYRQQTDALVRQSEIDISKIIPNTDTERQVQQSEKIIEMAAVMNRVALMDEESSLQDMENISQLITENRGLREMLQISRGVYESSEEKKQREQSSKFYEDVETLSRKYNNSTYMQ